MSRSSSWNPRLSGVFIWQISSSDLCLFPTNLQRRKKLRKHLVSKPHFKVYLWNFQATSASLHIQLGQSIIINHAESCVWYPADEFSLNFLNIHSSYPCFARHVLPKETSGSPDSKWSSLIPVQPLTLSDCCLVRSGILGLWMLEPGLMRMMRQNQKHKLKGEGWRWCWYSSSCYACLTLGRQFDAEWSSRSEDNVIFRGWNQSSKHIIGRAYLLLVNKDKVQSFALSSQ